MNVTRELLFPLPYSSLSTTMLFSLPTFNLNYSVHLQTLPKLPTHKLVFSFHHCHQDSNYLTFILLHLSSAVEPALSHMIVLLKTQDYSVRTYVDVMREEALKINEPAAAVVGLEPVLEENEHMASISG